MQDTLFVIGVTFAVLAGILFVVTISMFFGFRIPTLLKDVNGALEQKQIEEIRIKNSSAAQQKGKVNVFEELEKKAKVKKNNTQSLNLKGNTSARLESAVPVDVGTTVLQSAVNVINKDFIIEKNIMFVSTNQEI